MGWEAVTLQGSDGKAGLSKANRPGFVSASQGAAQPLRGGGRGVRSAPGPQSGLRPQVMLLSASPSENQPALKSPFLFLHLQR